MDRRTVVDNNKGQLQPPTAQVAQRGAGHRLLLAGIALIGALLLFAQIPALSAPQMGVEGRFALLWVAGGIITVAGLALSGRRKQQAANQS